MSVAGWAALAWLSVFARKTLGQEVSVWSFQALWNCLFRMLLKPLEHPSGPGKFAECPCGLQSAGSFPISARFKQIAMIRYGFKLGISSIRSDRNQMKMVHACHALMVLRYNQMRYIHCIYCFNANIITSPQLLRPNFVPNMQPGVPNTLKWNSSWSEMESKFSRAIFRSASVPVLRIQASGWG